MGNDDALILTCIKVLTIRTLEHRSFQTKVALSERKRFKVYWMFDFNTAMDRLVHQSAFTDIAPPNKTSSNKGALDSSTFNVNLQSMLYPEISPGDFKSASKRKVKKKSKEKSDKPKRALSAYNLFFQSERAKILSETSQPSRKPRRSHGKIGFAALARSVADKWKTLPAKEKTKFEAEALKEKERYEKEVEVWNQMRVAKMASNHGNSSESNQTTTSFPCEIQALNPHDMEVNEMSTGSCHIFDGMTSFNFQTQGNIQMMAPQLSRENNIRTDSINLSDCNPLDRDSYCPPNTGDRSILTLDNECLDILSALKNLESSDLTLLR